VACPGGQLTGMAAAGAGGSARRRLTGVLAVITAAVLCVQVVFVLDFPLGQDFYPLRNAAQDLLAGRSVYTDSWFVYPPTAAAVFTPLAAAGSSAARTWWTLLLLAALVGTGALLGRRARPGWRVVTGLGSVLLLAGGCTASVSVRLGNASVLLTSVTVLVLAGFERSRWLRATGLLTISALVKPLLVPLAVIPAVRRRWRELGACAAAGGALLAVAMLTIPGGQDVRQFVGYVLSGTNLHGTNAASNICLSGWVEAHHAPVLLGSAARGVVLLVAAAVVAVVVRARVAERVAPLGALVLATVFLAGSIAEVHYLLSLLAACLLAVIVQPSRFRAALYGPGVLLLGAPLVLASFAGHPMPLTSTARQNWDVLAELLLFAAAAVDLLRDARSARQAVRTK